MQYIDIVSYNDTITVALTVRRVDGLLEISDVLESSLKAQEPIAIKSISREDILYHLPLGFECTNSDLLQELSIHVPPVLPSESKRHWVASEERGIVLIQQVGYARERIGSPITAWHHLLQMLPAGACLLQCENNLVVRASKEGEFFQLSVLPSTLSELSIHSNQEWQKFFPHSISDIVLSGSDLTTSAFTELKRLDERISRFSLSSIPDVKVTPDAYKKLSGKEHLYALAIGGGAYATLPTPLNLALI